MMKLNSYIQTITFEIDYPSVPGFMVDIVETPEEYEAWIYHENVGIKDFMFGGPKSQSKDRSDFCDLVEVNLHVQDYISSYIDEYMSE